MDTKRCSAGSAGSTNFPCVACYKGSCRKTVFDDWSSAVCQIPTLLFALFYIYLIILAIIHVISKHENGIHCRIEPRWKERKQHIFIRRQARSMRPVLWRARRWTYGLQRRRSGCISASQHAWLDETDRPRLQPIWRYQRVCPATRDRQFQGPGEPKQEKVNIISIICLIQNK
jgi:hypothetical protein